MTPAKSQQQMMDAALRHDFESFGAKVFLHLNPGTRFLPNWHITAVHYHLDLIRRAVLDRLIIAMPPRSGKSIAASVALAAFIHGHDPSRRLICVSYSQDLATKLHNDYRSIIMSEWYRRLFPATRINPRKDTESQTELTGGGSRIATSIGGTLTGLGGDLIIIDDPLKAGDAYSEPKREAVNSWYSSTLLSRLNDKTRGAIVIVSQRLHMDDLVGYVLQRGGHWGKLELPAIADEDRTVRLADGHSHVFRKDDILHPDREPLKVLEQMRRDLGEAQFSAQYLQCPVPAGGMMFKRSWLRRYDAPMTPLPGDEIIQSWDTASKTAVTNDWSICATLLRRAGEYFLIDVTRQRLDYPALRQVATTMAHSYRARLVLVEDVGVGTALITDLRQAGVPARPVTATASKEARAAIQAAKFEGGLVLLPNKALWLADFEAELLAFPGGRHDDQVDAVCQALAYERPKMARTTTKIVRAY